MKSSVLLISVDALMPKYVFGQSNTGVELKNITKLFLENGTVASKGVQSVFPTFTYPCHQSIITGTNPKTHGIANNIVFDPTGEHNGAWNWFVSTKVETLWEMAKKNGFVSASAAFPTSVGAPGDYIAPEFWWDGSELDSAFINAVSRPQGLIYEMEKEIGRYAGGLDLSNAGDVQRYKAARWIIENRLPVEKTGKPFFMSAYFASFDESAHEYGVFSDEAKESLRRIDGMIGELYEAAKKASGDNLILCVVSDHGSLDNRYNISPNVAFVNHGLIKLDENGKVASWKAYSQRAGGTCEIRLHDRSDAAAAAELKKAIEELAADPDAGIEEALTGEEARARGGFPDADYVLVSKKGYEIRDNVTGPYCTTKLTQKAQHGYSEKFEEMSASFMITGQGIGKGDVGRIHLIDIAPTLAACMGFTMPHAEGHSVL